MTTYKDTNGTVWYVNLYDILELPDIFASTVSEWVDMTRDPWNKGNNVDSEWYPLQAETPKQLESRKETLSEGMGVIPPIRTHGRQSIR